MQLKGNEYPTISSQVRNIYRQHWCWLVEDSVSIFDEYRCPSYTWYCPVQGWETNDDKASGTAKEAMCAGLLLPYEVALPCLQCGLPVEIMHTTSDVQPTIHYWKPPKSNLSSLVLIAGRAWPIQSCQISTPTGCECSDCLRSGCSTIVSSRSWSEDTKCLWPLRSSCDHVLKVFIFFVEMDHQVFKLICKTRV